MPAPDGVSAEICVISDRNSPAVGNGAPMRPISGQRGGSATPLRN